MADKKTCDGWTLKTLKENIDGRFAHNKELRDAEAHALVIQAKEIERRLDGLNGEQARIAQSQATYVSRELWDKVQADDRVFRGRVESFMAINTGQGLGLGKAGQVILGIIAALAVVAAFLALRFK